MPLLLTLDNFEDDELSAGAPFVLTSPRSLRACANLGIRPADLLRRHRRDFEQLYQAAGRSLPPQKLDKMYAEYEGRRRDLLQQARAERRNIIRAKRPPARRSTKSPGKQPVAPHLSARQRIAAEAVARLSPNADLPPDAPLHAHVNGAVTDAVGVGQLPQPAHPPVHFTSTPDTFTMAKRSILSAKERRHTPQRHTPWNDDERLQLLAEETHQERQLREAQRDLQRRHARVAQQKEMDALRAKHKAEQLTQRQRLARMEKEERRATEKLAQQRAEQARLQSQARAQRQRELKQAQRRAKEQREAEAHAKLCQEQQSQLALKSAEQRRQRAMEQRVAEKRRQRRDREERQRGHYQRLQDEDQVRRSRKRSELQLKDAELARMQSERQQAHDHAREMAQLRQTLRGSLRDEFKSSEFDAMMREGQLRARAERVPTTKDWGRVNKSAVQLG
eukprot:m.298736 g.298736  ORF g.298736 m.298736 type:complete len:449 (+) comp19538_c0_seq3:487-1833(+)